MLLHDGYFDATSFPMLYITSSLFHSPYPQEKRRGSSRASTQEAPWIHLTLVRFFNTGIAVDLKIHLILDALLPLTLPMMTDGINAISQSVLGSHGWFLILGCFLLLLGCLCFFICNCRCFYSLFYFFWQKHVLTVNCLAERIPINRELSSCSILFFTRDK